MTGNLGRVTCLALLLVLLALPAEVVSQQHKVDPLKGSLQRPPGLDHEAFDFTVNRRDFEGWPLEDSLTIDPIEAERRKWLVDRFVRPNRPKLPSLPAGLRPDGLADPLTSGVPYQLTAPLLPSGDSQATVARPIGKAVSPKQYNFPQHNFELKVPGPGWEDVSFVKMQNPDIVVALGVPYEEQYLQVIAEQIGVEAGLDTATLQKLAVDALRLTVTDVDASNPVPLQIDGLNGLQTTVTATLKIAGIPRPVTYISWVCMHNGVGWQLLSWAPVRFTKHLENSWKVIPECFRLIDHDRMAKPSNNLTRRLYSHRFGVKADLHGTQFFVVPGINDEQDGSILVAAARFDSFIAVNPYTLPENGPSQKAVVESLLAAFGADVARARLKARRVQHGAFQAIEYHEIPSALDPERQRFFRICFAESYAYLIHGDAGLRNKTSAQEWTVAAKQIQFSPPRSVDLSAFTKNDRIRHAAFYSQLGLSNYNQGNVDRLAEYAVLAHEINPDDLSTLEESIDRLIAVGNFELVMPLLENLPLGVVIDPKRRAQQAWALAEVGRTEEALLKYEALFQTSYDNSDHLSFYTELLSEAGRTDDALAIVDRQLQASPSIDLAAERAQILLDGNRKSEAVTWLREQRDGSALARDAYSTTLIDVLLQADEHHEALAEAIKLEQSGEATPKVVMLKGLAEFKLERYVDSRKSLEATLEQAPNLTLAKELLEIISSRLGQGDVSAVLTKLEPVPLPGGVAIRHPAPKNLNEEDDYWVEIDARSVAFKPGEEFRSTRTKIIHVLNRNAVEAFGRLQFDFDSVAEQFYINRAEVYDENDILIGATDPRDCFVLANEDDGLATNQKTLNVPLPGLRPGCRIEYQATWQHHAAPEQFPSRRFSTERYSPTSRVVVAVSGDLSTLRWTGPQPTQTQNTILWNIAAGRLTSENMVDDLTVSPSTICLGDSQSTWKQIGEQYITDIRDRMTPSSEAAQIAEHELAGLSAASSSSQVDHLAEWVRRELTYQGIEFGQRAWVMPPVEQTLQNRYGDCKDHSMLLWQLLQAAGIKAHLALVNVGEPVELRLPSSGQFNHMIVYVEDDQGGRFIDCTDKSVAGSIRVPSGLALKVALVLDPENPRMMRLPDYPEGYNRVWIDRSITLNADGAAEIDETLWFDGYTASFMRQMMAAGDREGQKSIVRSLLPATANATISKLHFENPESLSQQPILRVSYSTPHYVSAAPGQLIGRVNMLDGIGGISLAVEESREQPFRLRMPLDTSARIRIKAPNGFTVSDTPEREVVQTKVLDAVRETSRTDDTLEMRVRVRRRTARLHPSAWANWRTTCQQVNELLTPNLILSK